MIAHFEGKCKMWGENIVWGAELSEERGLSDNCHTHDAELFVVTLL